MAYALKQYDIGVRNKLAVTLRHMRAGNRICRAVNQSHRQFGLLLGADPTFSILSAIDNVADNLMRDLHSVFVVYNRPKIAQLVIGRLCSLSEDGGEASTKTLFGDRF